MSIMVGKPAWQVRDQLGILLDAPILSRGELESITKMRSRIIMGHDNP